MVCLGKNFFPNNSILSQLTVYIILLFSHIPVPSIYLASNNYFFLGIRKRTTQPELNALNQNAKELLI